MSRQSSKGWELRVLSFEFLGRCRAEDFGFRVSGSGLLGSFRIHREC